ncbi:MAG: leucine-rich repeat protein [Clostridia bacterium]|nr:leucine-rich repeat protein [Clostridia bacterium]
MSVTAMTCPVCGGELTGEGRERKCRYCGAVHLISDPLMTDELQTANAFRECTRFAEAETLYKQIAKKYRGADLSEVYWNLLLCEQHVMFETDAKGERFPSFYAVVPEEIEDSLYYINAVDMAERYAPERAEIFKDLAGKMIRAKQLYGRISETSKPFEIFICFKKSAADGGNTPDCALANDLYNEFAKDYRIFFSERSLKNVVVRDFEPNIYYGLYTAKVMLLLCSQKDYIESQWVKNEWSRFCAFAGNPATGKTVIPIFIDGFRPYALPNELVSYQGLADGRQLFGDLEKTLKKILKPVDTEKQIEMEVGKRLEQFFKQQEEERQRALAEQQHRAEEESRRREAEEQRRAEEEQQRQKLLEDQQKQFAEQQKAWQAQMEALRTKQAEQFGPAPAPTAPAKESVSQKSVPVVAKERPNSDFEIENGILKKYNGTASCVVIPDGVTVIDRAFARCDTLEEVTIPEGVTCIGRSAFYACSNLRKVSFPSTLKSIDTGAFRYCKDLRDLKLPRSLESVYSDAFANCAGLESIEMEQGNPHYYTKDHCLIYTKMKWVSLGCRSSRIPDDGSVTAICSSAFEGCTGLTRIEIPSAITELYDRAFRSCTALKTVIFHEGLKKIDIYAFQKCTALEEIVIPATVTSVCMGAFEGCENLKSALIPETLSEKNIGDKAFHDRRKCKVTRVPVTAPTSKPAPAAPAFATENQKPASPKSASVSQKAVNSAPKPDKPSYDPNEFEIKDGVLVKYKGRGGDVVIPDGVTAIGKNAFEYCSGELTLQYPPVRSVKIPPTVTVIGESAFVGCHLIEQIELPLALTTIGGNAFGSCTGLKSITIPPSVVSIGSNAFRNCTALTDIRYNAKEAESALAGSAFWDDNAKGRGVTVTIGANVIGIPFGIFNGHTGIRSVVFEKECACSFICEASFSRCTDLESIILPKSLKSINSKAFCRCDSLTAISVEEGNETYHSAGNCLIETAAKKLVLGCQSSVIPDDGSVTAIGELAFFQCINLKEIHLPASIRSLPWCWDMPWMECLNLERITVDPQNTEYHSSGDCLIETGSKRLLYGCKNSIIPDDGSVKTICRYAFLNCIGLTAITIPSAVKEVEDKAFKGCTNLKDIKCSIFLKGKIKKQISG